MQNVSNINTEQAIIETKEIPWVNSPELDTHSFNFDFWWWYKQLTIWDDDCYKWANVKITWENEVWISRIEPPVDTWPIQIWTIWQYGRTWSKMSSVQVSKRLSILVCDDHVYESKWPWKAMLVLNDNWAVTVLDEIFFYSLSEYPSISHYRDNLYFINGKRHNTSYEFFVILEVVWWNKLSIYSTTVVPNTSWSSSYAGAIGWGLVYWWKKEYKFKCWEEEELMDVHTSYYIWDDWEWPARLYTFSEVDYKSKLESWDRAWIIWSETWFFESGIFINEVYEITECAGIRQVKMDTFYRTEEMENDTVYRDDVEWAYIYCNRPVTDTKLFFLWKEVGLDIVVHWIIELETVNDSQVILYNIDSKEYASWVLTSTSYSKLNTVKNESNVFLIIMETEDDSCAFIAFNASTYIYNTERQVVLGKNQGTSSVNYFENKWFIAIGGDLYDLTIDFDNIWVDSTALTISTSALWWWWYLLTDVNVCNTHSFRDSTDKDTTVSWDPYKIYAYPYYHKPDKHFIWVLQEEWENWDVKPTALLWQQSLCHTWLIPWSRHIRWISLSETNMLLSRYNNEDTHKV